MATYSTVMGNDGKIKHLPLKNALIEYKNDNVKLMELLSTVNKASKKSTFISGLVDSGEIFHPIGLSQEEAFIFLKEIPIVITSYSIHYTKLYEQPVGSKAMSSKGNTNKDILDGFILSFAPPFV